MENTHCNHEKKNGITFFFKGTFREQDLINPNNRAAKKK